MDNRGIENALQKLQHYIEAENYCGYDPYDFLKSPLFKLPFLRSNKIVRFGAQQFGKRFPINIRPLFFVPKGKNPVTLGLSIQAYSSLIKIFPGKKSEIEEKISFLIDELEKLIPENFYHACWGYDFDWESRYAKIPAYQPTIVSTGIVANALFTNYKITGWEKSFELCESASKFVLENINRTYDSNGNFCFSYSPFDKQVVFNASMKGARLLAQVYSVTQTELLKSESKKAVSFVMNHQQEDGAWQYSKSKAGTWIDNYHTGYILDCLDEYIKYCGDNSFLSNLQSGFQFYKNNFFRNENFPKFYSDRSHPLDCTAGGQSILTLLRFGEKSIAIHVAENMIDKMQSSSQGYFYFRKFKHYKIKTSFMRWSNAWMFVALSELVNE